MDSRFSRSRRNRNNSPSGLSGARSARAAFRERKGSVESAAQEIRSLRDDFRAPNLQGDREYERREREKFYNDGLKVTREWGQMPIGERRDQEAALLEAMRDPELIEERAGWLIDGSYGKGAYDAAREVIRKPRMNREAWLMQTLGEVEWRVPRTVVVRVWKKLAPREQAALDVAIKRAIRDGLAEE